jgi:hypothetical protein
MVLAEWRAHPARSRPRDTVLVVAVVLLSTGAVLASLESFFLAALAAVFLLASVATFLLPTRYTLTDEGVVERRFGRRRERHWKDLRRLQVGPGAALVSPFGRRHLLERYRGLVILLDGADRDAVIDILRAKVCGGAQP